MYHAAVVRGTPTQEELKRRSVQAFMMTTEPLPEDPEDIPHILQHIARCSAGAVSLRSPSTCGESTQRPTTFCPAQNYCMLCNGKLTCPTHIPGSNGKSYLLTRMGMTCDSTGEEMFKWRVHSKIWIQHLEYRWRLFVWMHDYCI